MKPISHIVEYKDSGDDTPLLFGPFPSTGAADFFRASLPAPRKGGWARNRTVQPFTAQEGHTISQIIQRRRHQAA